MTNHKHKAHPATVEPTPPPPVPEAYKFLTYTGDHRHAVGRVMGPTYSGAEVLTVVSATHDPTTDRTRLGLVYGVHQVPEPVAS